MTLDKWLTARNWTDQRMADECLACGKRVTRQAVQFWRKGDRRPNAASMAALTAATCGAVTVKDFSVSYQARRKKEKFRG